MSEESDDDKCNCKECWQKPSHSIRVVEGRKEPANAIKIESGLKRGFLNPRRTPDDSTSNKGASDAVSPTTPIDSFNEVLIARNKTTATPETIECEKISLPEIQHNEVKMEAKCTKCIESNDTIDLLNQGAFMVSCSDGCMITMHRSCFEKALGSGKKKELKSSTCPCDSPVAVITHRSPGRNEEFKLWLRCEGKEPERPKKEDKTKAKGKEKDIKLKKDRRDEEETRKVSGDSDNLNTQSSSLVSEERPIISLAPSLKQREEDIKKNLVKPLPADLDARPIERKEDALMSKYAVKEPTKEAPRKKKKEVRQVILPGLTVKGQRGKREEDDVAPWTGNENEESEENNGMAVENIELKYEEGPYGFAMPEPVGMNGMIGGADWNREEVGDMMTNNMEMNNYHNQFHHPLPTTFGVFRPSLLTESFNAVHASSQSFNDNTARNSLSGFTESPNIEEPPLIENPFDYPTLERPEIRERNELINFFETNLPILEENASLFDSSQIDLEQLMSMLESFIEFQSCGSDEEKRIMIETLHSIFVGEVENDIIPFLIDLQCFKYGYIDGRLVVSVKTEGIERREREEEMRREREEEERRKKDEEERKKKEREEVERRKEEMGRETVRRAVLEIEQKRKIEEQKRKLIEEEAIRMEEEKERKKNEETKRMEEQRRKNEEAKALEKRRKEEEDKRKMEQEEEQRKIKEKEERERKASEEEKRRKEAELIEQRRIENERRILEEKRQKNEEEERERRRIQDMIDEEEELRVKEALTSKKDEQKKTKERELERKTREAINTLRRHHESKSSSSETSPERKELLKAPAFYPSADYPFLIDENGTEVDETWIDDNRQVLEENRNTIEELSRRIAELEAEKMEMAEKNRLVEMEMANMDGMRVKEEYKKNETISHLQAQIREKDDQIVRKDTRISEITVESEKKSTQLNKMGNEIGSKLIDMKTKMDDYNGIIKKEREDKEKALVELKKHELTRKYNLLERKSGCAKESVIMCTHIINKLAGEADAQVMTSIFIDLRRKWMEHYSNMKYALNAYKRGESIDLDAVLSLEAPSMPKETTELVKECYVWHYQTMHSLSFRLAGIVKRCLRDHQRYYEDAHIIGVIQKWMRTHKDPTKIDATVPQVANMVCIALGDTSLMPPKYVYAINRVSSCPSAPSAPSTPTQSSTTHLRTQSSLNKNDQPKGWKKASDKVRQVDRDHECSICLEDTEGGDISYCEQISCNEPYHNDCLDQYWKTGGRFCPRCRTPMPPRDAYPALA